MHEMYVKCDAAAADNGIVHHFQLEQLDVFRMLSISNLINRRNILHFFHKITMTTAKNKKEDKN